MFIFVLKIMSYLTEVHKITDYNDRLPTEIHYVTILLYSHGSVANSATLLTGN